MNGKVGSYLTVFTSGVVTYHKVIDRDGDRYLLRTLLYSTNKQHPNVKKDKWVELKSETEETKTTVFKFWNYLPDYHTVCRVSASILCQLD